MKMGRILERGLMANCTKRERCWGAQMSQSTTTGVPYDTSAAVTQLRELDGLLSQVQTPGNREKFQKVQEFLKKNNNLICEVQKKQAEVASAPDGISDKAALQKVSELIMELNENLTQIYSIYAELAPAKED